MLLYIINGTSCRSILKSVLFQNLEINVYKAIWKWSTKSTVASLRKKELLPQPDLFDTKNDTQ